jgi:hypothetical protein
LAQDRPVPAQTEPFEVGQHLIRQFGPAAGAVDILDPDQKFAAPSTMRPARQIMRDHRRIGVAKVQQAVGAGGKAGADRHSDACPVDCG